MIEHLMCEGSNDDPCSFLKGFTAGFGPMNNAWNVVRPQMFVREILVSGQIAYEVMAGLDPSIELGTFMSKDDAWMHVD